MKIISAILYFLSHHPGWSFPLLMIFFGLLWSWRKKTIYGLLVLLAPIANIFLAHMLNAWFLNKFGVKGTAVITQSEQTNSTLNDQYIYDYDVLVKTADGKDVLTGFSTMSAAIYPVRNSILIPNVDEPFLVKYIPGYEKNIVILSDESNYGIARKIMENQQEVQKAWIQYKASPQNKSFKDEYLQVLKKYVADSNNASEPDVINNYKTIIQQLEAE
ncbi:hypothetical protein ACTJJ0_34045 [Chitinophaga sp. 22321]|uniref:Uncharacterized protein n=1 Tax=Chitinophaga hostae TaxID=2831022 RepID=A0ABS5JAS4_9BACT|nr:hypothetical protein [Chitinophaga hostae]MBS0032315.1 hypothetical protein [Chitinophaga hostae]